MQTGLRCDLLHGQREGIAQHKDCALLLRERLTVFTVLGAVLILGAAVLCELPERKKPEA